MRKYAKKSNWALQLLPSSHCRALNAFYAIVVGGGVVVEGEQVFGVLVFNRLQRG